MYLEEDGPAPLKTSAEITDDAARRLSGFSRAAY